MPESKYKLITQGWASIIKANSFAITVTKLDALKIPPSQGEGKQIHSVHMDRHGKLYKQPLGGLLNKINCILEMIQ